MTLKGIFGSMSVFTMQASTRHCRESLAFTITLQRSENALNHMVKSLYTNKDFTNTEP